MSEVKQESQGPQVQPPIEGRFDFVDPFDVRQPRLIEGLPGVYVSYPPKPAPLDFGSIIPAEMFTVSVLPDSPSYPEAKAAQDALKAAGEASS